jgi:hypothetical protein
MDRQNETQKKRAQRIDLNYFKKTFPIPHWRRVLSVVFTGIGLLWLAWALLARSEKPFNAGPVSHGHAMIKCADCHITPAAWGTKVTDESCKVCHQGPQHHAREDTSKDIPCMDCHAEHKGAMHLAATSEAACTQCHKDLKPNGQFKFVVASAHAISGFSKSDGHPDLRVFENRTTDPGTLKFNHSVHMKKGLLDIHGKGQVLECSDCHRLGATRALWTYADPNIVPPPTVEWGPSEQRPARDLMEPLTFNKNCSNCHSLLFSEEITAPVTHGIQPVVLRPWIETQFTDFIKTHPAVLAEAMRVGIGPTNLVEQAFDQRFGVGPHPHLAGRRDRAPPRNAAEWVKQKMDDTDRLLWGKTCKECHSLTYLNAGDRPLADCPATSTIPCVPKPNVTVRWMNHAVFDHKAHEMVKCEGCHDKVRESKDTADVLLPHTQVCETCHAPSEAKAGSSCSECHAYHDWSSQKPVNGRYSVSELK